MSVYTSLFIRRCFSACVSLYSLVSLILLNRVAWLVLLFEFFSLSDGNGFGLSVRVKISTPWLSRFTRLSSLLFSVVTVPYQNTNYWLRLWSGSLSLWSKLITLVLIFRISISSSKLSFNSTLLSPTFGFYLLYSPHNLFNTAFPNTSTRPVNLLFKCSVLIDNSYQKCCINSFCIFLSL